MLLYNPSVLYSLRLQEIENHLKSLRSDLVQVEVMSVTRRLEPCFLDIIRLENKNKRIKGKHI